MTGRAFAVQAAELAPLVHPREPGEWHFYPSGRRVVPAGLPAVTGYASPDSCGAVVWIEQRQWTPEQLDGLISFLVAVRAAQTAGEPT